MSDRLAAEGQTDRAEEFGTRPGRRPRPGKRFIAVLAGVGFAGAAATVGAWQLWPKPQPDPFAEIPYLSGSEIACHEVANFRYGTDEPGHQQIAGGNGSALFTAEDARIGGLAYLEHELVQPATVAACRQYLKDHSGTAENALFSVSTQIDPPTGQEGNFRITVVVVPTGDIISE